MTLVDALELSAGETVRVVGATGGVGSLAVQLAVAAGATVIAPALPEDEDFLRELGVSRRLDRDGDMTGVRADAVVDLVSYAPGAFDAGLEPGGRVASPNSAAGEEDSYDLDRAPEALEALGSAHTRGKLAISVA